MIWTCQLVLVASFAALVLGGAPQAASGWRGAGAHPAGSLDYVSRYHGPIAVPVVLPDGTLANTPEVAAARSQHLAALAKAKALWYGYGGSSVGSSSWPSTSSGSAWPSSAGGSSGSAWPSSAGGSSAGAWPSSSGGSSGGAWPSGSSASAWPSSSGGSSGGAWPSSSGWSTGSGWAGPQASPSVLSSGYLADTPVNAAARAAHLGAVAKALQEAEKWKPQSHGWN